jgi:hypothetical protein
MASKNYDYYNDVVDLLLPNLNEQGIDIIQIGGEEDRRINGCIHYNGATNLKQVCYLIQNSTLHLGNDSFGVHVASGFNKKIVALYSVLFKECCGPYWGDKSQQILLEPNRSKTKPSFSSEENPKSVNQIKPEDIAGAVLKLLKSPPKTPLPKTLHIGKEYHLPSVAIVPNFVMPLDFLGGQPVNILGNECLDEQNIARWGYGRKVNIFLKEPMQIKYLQMIKSNIIQINYEASMDTNPTYLKVLNRAGIKTQIFSKDEDKIKDIRLHLFDWNIALIKNETKKDLDNCIEICDNTRYKNSRTLYSGGQKYSSKAAWLRNIPQTTDEKIIDCPEFWEEINTLKLYNKEEKNGKTKREQKQERELVG